MGPVMGIADLCFFIDGANFIYGFQVSSLGLAGVMGGAASEVRDDTTSIVLEVAAFSRTMVRKTSKRLGLQSEASYRFERGTDLNRLVQGPCGSQL